MGHEVEADFVHCGIKCVVLAIDQGHRCGYVRVPQNSPLDGKKYDDEIFEFVSVHGTLTFSESDLDGVGGWWVGFDCAHFDDEKDESIMSPEYLEFYLGQLENPSSIINFFRSRSYKRIMWTREMVVEETKRLAEQVSDFCSLQGKIS